MKRKSSFILYIFLLLCRVDPLNLMLYEHGRISESTEWSAVYRNAQRSFIGTGSLEIKVTMLKK